MGNSATHYPHPAILFVLLLIAVPAGAVDCPPVAGLVAQNTGGGGTFSAMEAPSVKAGLSCTYRDPRDGNQPVAYLQSGWTVSAEESSFGWCLSYDSTDTRDYELEIDQKMRTFRFVGLSRAFDVQVTVSEVRPAIWWSAAAMVLVTLLLSRIAEHDWRTGVILLGVYAGFFVVLL